MTHDTRKLIFTDGCCIFGSVNGCCAPYTLVEIFFFALLCLKLRKKEEKNCKNKWGNKEKHHKTGARKSAGGEKLKVPAN